MNDAKTTPPPGTLRERLGALPRPARLALELAAFAALFLAVRAFQTRGLATGAAPETTLPRLAGGSVVVGAADTPRVVHFFATWCGVCRLEEGNVAALDASDDVLWVASMSGSADEVEGYLREHGLTGLDVALDPDGRAARAWGVGAFPSTFFLNDAGHIVTREVGYTSTLGLWVRRLWSR